MTERPKRGIGVAIRLHQHQRERAGAVAQPGHVAGGRQIGRTPVDHLHRGVAAIKIDTLLQIANHKGYVGKTAVNFLHSAAPYWSFCSADNGNTSG